MRERKNRGASGWPVSSIPDAEFARYPNLSRDTLRDAVEAFFGTLAGR